MVNWAEYRDMAKHVCPPPGTQIHNPFGAALATTAPQMLTEIFGMFADSERFSSSHSDDGDVIAKLSNDDTKNIKSIINKLKTADSSMKPIYQAQLDTAIKDYYKNHKVGDNKSIDNLPQAKKYCENNGIS